MSAVVVITGVRKFAPNAAWSRALADAYRQVGAVAVFEGEAAGADKWAGAIARAEDIPVHQVPALWTAQGRKAGPVRNARMLLWAVMLGAELSLPVVLLAMPGERGTEDMKRRARGRRLRIIEVQP